MKEISIKKIELLYVNKPEKRKVKVTLSNNTKIYIERCYESWEQYGGTMNELFITQPIAERYNVWLHGNDYCR